MPKAKAPKRPPARAHPATRTRKPRAPPKKPRLAAVRREKPTLPVFTPQPPPVPSAPPPTPPPSAPTFVPVHLPEEPPPRVPIEATLSLRQRIGIPAALFLLALLLYGSDLGHPPQIVFDEAHYVRASRSIAHGQLVDPSWPDPRPVNFEHPPLAKFLIAASLNLFGRGQLDLTYDQYFLGCEKAATEKGDDGKTDPPCPAGRTWEGCNHPNPECAPEAAAWRLPGLLLGASGIVALYLLALRLFNRLAAGVLASLLLLSDPMWYLHSRMALLDIFPAAFTLWAFAFALGEGLARRLLGGVFLGLAIASKYNAVFLLPVFILVLLIRFPAHRLPARPVLHSLGDFFHALGRILRHSRAVRAVAVGLLLPIAVWLLSYAPYWVTWIDHGGLGYAFGQFQRIQAGALAWDYSGTFQHHWASGPLTWIPLLRPTYYYAPNYLEARPPFIYAVGNPILWWTATLALLIVPLYLLTRWIRRHLRAYVTRDFFAALPQYEFHLTPRRSLFLAALLFWGGFLPWFLLQRTTFNYYVTYNVPYFALFAGGLGAAWWMRGRWRRKTVFGFVVLCLLMFVTWWPIVFGAEVSNLYFDTIWSLVPWMRR